MRSLSLAHLSPPGITTVKVEVPFTALRDKGCSLLITISDGLSSPSLISVWLCGGAASSWDQDERRQVGRRNTPLYITLRALSTKKLSPQTCSHLLRDSQRCKGPHSKQPNINDRSPKSQCLVCPAEDRGAGCALNSLSSCNRCEAPGKSHLQPRPSNPSCTEGKAPRKKLAAGRGNPGFKGSRQVSDREGGVAIGLMEREGRRCPFKRRRPSGNLFSFPGRKAEPGLGAQGGEVRGWAVGRRGARRGGSLSPALLAIECLPF